jgi:AcrR family transcriptional regulator
MSATSLWYPALVLGRARSPKVAARKKKPAAAAATGAGKRTRLEVDERRAQLVELGLTEFGSSTFEEVSIDRLAQMAGISKGLLYHYFPTKRAFYAACVREAAGRLLARMEAVPRDGTPQDGLRRGIEAYLDHVRGHGRAYATLMRGGIGIDREIAAVVDETRATLLANLTRGIAEFLPPGLDVSSPILRIALQGWIGLAEAASIAWVERCVEAEHTPGRGPLPPSAAAVRDVLANAFVAVVQGALAV